MSSAQPAFGGMFRQLIDLGVVDCCVRIDHHDPTDPYDVLVAVAEYDH
jgi:nanoRNase/pAp phosphatase (c-di-AMP/oligoRNAs hydrolase)